MRRRVFALVPVAALLGALAWGLAPERAPLPDGTRADSVAVHKGRRTLTVYRGGRPLRTYRVSLGGAPAAGHKRQEGDERTPEGRYVLDWRNPTSMAHRSLHVSYPNAEDRQQAVARGVSPGGNVMVHGLRNGLGWMGRWHRLWDWTDGCVAVTNREMDELWRILPTGTPITLTP